MFVVSMTTPWNILDQLQKWAAILQDHIDKLNIASHKLEEYRNKCKLITDITNMRIYICIVCVCVCFRLYNTY